MELFTQFKISFSKVALLLTITCMVAGSCTAKSLQEQEVNTETLVTKEDRSPSTSLTDRPKLKRIFFNLYADSIKPVMNYYVAVDGELMDGSFLPLDQNHISLTCDHGRMEGNEWIIPKQIDFEKVTFTATALDNPSLEKSITVYLRKMWNYDEGVLEKEDVMPGKRKK